MFLFDGIDTLLKFDIKLITGLHYIEVCERLINAVLYYKISRFAINNCSEGLSHRRHSMDMHLISACMSLLTCKWRGFS